MKQQQQFIVSDAFTQIILTKMGNIPNCCNNSQQLSNIKGQQIHLSSTDAEFFQKSEIPPDLPKLIKYIEKSKQIHKNISFPKINEKIKQLLVSRRGQFQEFLCSGKGRKKIQGFKNGEKMAVYEGEENKGERGERGKILFGDSSYFQGRFRNGVPSQGVYIFPNAIAFYCGEINNYEAHGSGYFQHISSGYTYEGNWLKNLPHEQGTQKLANGDIYKGKFNYGSKFGDGRYQFKNGDVYEGQLYNDFIDGYGKLTTANGQVYEGDWKLGKMHGKGKYKWKNGEKYVGQYKNGEREGFGTYYYQNGSRYEGPWSKGLQNGIGSILLGYDQVRNRWQNGVRKEDDT